MLRIDELKGQDTSVDSLDARVETLIDIFFLRVIYVAVVSSPRLWSMVLHLPAVPY